MSSKKEQRDLGLKSVSRLTREGPPSPPTLLPRSIRQITSSPAQQHTVNDFSLPAKVSALTAASTLVAAAAGRAE